MGEASENVKIDLYIISLSLSFSCSQIYISTCMCICICSYIFHFKYITQIVEVSETHLFSCPRKQDSHCYQCDIQNSFSYFLLNNHRRSHGTQHPQDAMLRSVFLKDSLPFISNNRSGDLGFSLTIPLVLISLRL